MNKELFENLSLISSFIAVIPLLLAIFNLKKLSKIQTKLVYILVIVLVVESISSILWNQKINNLPLYHFYTVIEFLLIINIFMTALSGVFSKLFFLIVSIVFIVFAIVNTLFFQDLYTFNSNATSVLGILVIFFALSYFYALLKEMKYNALETNPMFWISSGFLIYFSSNLILFYINNSLFKGSTEASYLVWGLHAIINIVLTIFYTIAIWVKPKEQLH